MRARAGSFLYFKWNIKSLVPLFSLLSVSFKGLRRLKMKDKNGQVDEFKSETIS